MDLVIFDAQHKLVPADRWQVFEQKTFRGRSGDSPEPREAAVADDKGKVAPDDRGAGNGRWTRWIVSAAAVVALLTGVGLWLGQGGKKPAPGPSKLQRSSGHACHSVHTARLSTEV